MKLLVGVATVFLLGLPFLAILTKWLEPQSIRQGTDDFASLSESEQKQPLMKAPAPRPVDDMKLYVVHFARTDKGDRLVGELGKESFAAHRDDGVTIEAALRQPAYAYLIAFRPDGTEEVCFPEKEDEPPPLTNKPRYPSVSKGVHYGLEEGEGLQVFALVVSHEPLPAYKDWRARCGPSPWKKHPATAGVVWRDDGSEVEALTDPGMERTRGKGQEVRGRTPLVALTEWLRRAPQVEKVAALGFAVLPKNKP